MSLIIEECKVPVIQKPQVYISTITFNDSTQIPLEHSSIIVFTGSNNSGKSQVLKDIEQYMDESSHAQPIIIKEAEVEYYGSIDEAAFFITHFFTNSQGYYQRVDSNDTYDKDSLQVWWNEHTLFNNLHTLFVKLLSTELRLTSSNALVRNKNPEKHTIYKLNTNEKLAQKLSDYFHQAFGVDLIVNRSDMQTIPLHIGHSPDKQNFTIANQDEYYHQVAALPKLQEQGDGMRSFASILLDTFTSDHTITLIDEPEAFLHPPQARILGKMIAKNNPDGRQMFISTHSEDFLHGLLDANNQNVSVVRINRQNDTNIMSILNNDEIKRLWGNPLLRYSNILSGLFHEKVVVCESDYDCLFYQALIDAIYESKHEVSPDILFTHCGGKTRIKDVVCALEAVKVPIVAICDFDILNKKPVFKSIIEAFGLDWNTTICAEMRIIYDSMNAKANAWEQIKKIGKPGFTGNEPAAYRKVEEVCKSTGLFIVPVGEMEDFDKTVNKEKKDWVYYVLENYNLASEPKLEEARKFIQAIVDYKSTNSLS